MKGDFTRSTFKRERHYSAVRMQQGRVQLDADWNEQLDISAHRIRTDARDTIGLCGGPVHNAGFHIVAAAADLSAEEKQAPENQSPPAVVAPDLLVSGGRYYVDGTLCENERIVLLSDQPDMPEGAAIVRMSNNTTVAFPPPAGTYVFYLDVWQRHITALDDPSIREVALGGPDTATRSRTVWQVKLLQAPAGTGCSSVLADWNALTAKPTGRLAARSKPGEVSKSPCIVAPGAGYRRLENQLYRVEVHQGGALGSATFKWSRDNGSIVTSWKAKNGNDLTVGDLGRDSVLGLNGTQWVELTDDTRELMGQPGTLVQLVKAEGNVLTIDPTTATGTLSFADFPLNPKVRRWDNGPDDPALRKVELPGGNDGFIPLEDGVEVRFSAGSYRTGDYWLIPARTATGDVEWPQDAPATPSALAPHGVEHDYCRLAVGEFDGAAWKLADCRDLFPPLTEIEDPEAAHKKHNKYLHGWGVVCGLQVQCAGKDRNAVQVNPGYAIACDGTDIWVDALQKVSLVEAAKAKKLLNDAGDGKVCLTLASPAKNQFIFEVKADPGPGNKTVLQQILEGTLANDVYQDCVKPVMDFLKKLLVDEEPNEKRLVGDAARRRIAVTNLLVQVANKSDGSRVFLSRDEHDRLLDVYKALQKFITSKTFCGMFDNLSAFPDYPFDNLGIATGYGKVMHQRLRVRPDGRMAYAFGAAGSLAVHGFDPEKGELVAEFSVPAQAGMDLEGQGLAFFGSGLMVAASGSKGSVLLAFDGNHKQVEQPVVVPGKRIVRLAQFAQDKTGLYALVTAQGLYRFLPEDFGADSFAQPLVPFNATGHLEVGVGLSQGVAVATAADDAGGETDIYNRVAVITFTRDGPVRSNVELGATGRDGLGLLVGRAGTGRISAAAGSGGIFVVVDPKPNTTQKRVLVFSGGTAPAADIQLPADGPVTLSAAPNQDFMLVAMGERNQVALVNPANNQLAANLPAQIHPAALASREGQALVLNRVSQTLTFIPAKLIGTTPALDFAALAEYRGKLVTAYTELFSRLAQMVKDCLCEHLLAACPTCGKDDELVLACVEIKGNKVFHICNLDRREVVTFPKFFYWLSAVPVVPLVTWAVERFCCTLLPGLADAALKRSGDLASSRQIAQASDRLNIADMKAAGSELLSRFGLVTKHLGSAAMRDVAAPAPGRVVLRTNDVIDRDAATVQANLSTAGIEVARVAEYDEALAGSALQDAARVPLGVQPGERVNLYTREGKVVFFTRAEPSEAAALRSQVEGLRQEIAQLSQQAREVISARDAEIATLRESLESVKASLAEVETLKKQVARLARQRGEKAGE